MPNNDQTYLSQLNIDGAQYKIKDAELRTNVGDLTTIIQSNNDTIATYINDLNERLEDLEDLQPLVIEVSGDINENTTAPVPSGTYASITDALDNGQNIILKVSDIGGGDYAYLYLIWDEGNISNEYKFGGIYYNSSLSASINYDDSYSFTHNGLALSLHTHGNIKSNGALQTTDITIANNDKLVVTDASNLNTIARTSITFDGSTTTQALSKKGTWETFYQKASIGIPESDLASGIQTSLGKADSSIQGVQVNGTDLTSNESNYVNVETKLSTGYQASSLEGAQLTILPQDTYETAISKLDKTIEDNELVTTAALTDLDARVTNIANNEFSGDYNDLINKPKNFQIDYSKEYLTIECLSAGTITITASHASVSKTISYSTDNGSAWTNLTTSTSAQSLGTFAIGDKVLIKGANNAYGNISYYNFFGGTAQVKVYGNIMSLIYGDNFIGQTSFPADSSNNFRNLFYNYTNLTDASNLILAATTLTWGCYYYMFSYCTNLTQAPELPATTLTDSCYYCMFQSCTSLTKAPKLPATTLANSCYCYMFYLCTSLIKAPELPATTLTDSCYAKMFSNCESLIKAPELPATTLTQDCYAEMFYNCTSLTTAPELLATTLTQECYYHMFAGCTSLNEITCLAINISAEDCTTNWVQTGVATGTFIKHPDMDSWTIGVNGIPSGWTVYNAYAKEIEENNEFDDLINVDHTYYVQKSNSVVLPLSHPDMSTQPSILPERFGKYYTYEVLIPIFGDRNVVDGDEITDDEIIPYISDNESYLAFKEGDLLMKNSIILSASIIGNGVYNNPTIVKDKYRVDYSGQYLTFECLSAGTITITASDSDVFKTISYSTDNGSTWNNLTTSTSTKSLGTFAIGDKVLVKGTNDSYGNGSGYYNKFGGTAQVKVYGNIMSLIYGDNFIGQTSFPLGSQYNFRYLFYQYTNLMDASNLVLPATILILGCYSGMFQGCIGLTTSPELPATTLVNSCYEYMFNGCTNLNKITCLATDIFSALYPTWDWVGDVASTGTFIKNPNMSSWNTESNNGIPSGWSLIDYLPNNFIYKIFTMLPLDKYVSKMNYLLVKYCNEAYLGGGGYYSDDEYAY